MTESMDEGKHHVVLDIPPASIDVPWTSSAVPSRSERDDAFDKEILHRAIADTGRWAFGTIAVESWVLDESTGKIVPSALWVDPAFLASIKEKPSTSEAMMRRTDAERDDYVGPGPLAPGIGLAGALWGELARNMSGRHGALAELIPKRVVWRDVGAISSDPDQPYHLRLKLAVEAGIGLVAGVPFQFRSARGLVLFMARKTADIDKLKSRNNTDYLLSATDVIGSIIALQGPRRACLIERRNEREDVRRRVRLKMIAILNIGGSFLREGRGKMEQIDHVDQISGNRPPSNFVSGAKKRGTKYCGILKNKFMLVARKCRGADNEPPPLMSNFESVWTFWGCFLSLLMLLNFSDAITKRNASYSLVTGPFGALMTLQYSLTAAPASQPRNAILGQAISLSIALAMTYTGLDKNLRRSLGTAIAIMCMARLGITHPPAGAAALIFSGDGYSWGHMGIMLAGNVLAIFSAAAINNMNVKRQYPTFWGFGYWCRHFGRKKRSA